MKKLVYFINGGDMECPEEYRCAETEITCQNDISEEEIINMWCMINGIDKDKLNKVCGLEFKNIEFKNGIWLYWGRQIIIEDIYKEELQDVVISTGS